MTMLVYHLWRVMMMLTISAIADDTSVVDADHDAVVVAQEGLGYESSTLLGGKDGPKREKIGSMAKC
jgi:hypothetical protein